MEQNDWIARNFEESRGHLKAVAYRMLGSADQAEDAVQEAWMRLSRANSEKVENLRGWLTTVVSRICLDMLRSRKSRSEESLEDDIPEIAGEESIDPEANVMLADSVGPALLVVLDSLTPPERIAFVLHDLFDLSFEEIGPIIDRSEAATRQLASRARRRIRGVTAPAEDRDRQQKVVSAFLAASREGNFEALLEMLHPDVLVRADETAVKVTGANASKGAPQFKREIRGARTVAELFRGTATAARLALVNGSPAAVWPATDKPMVAFRFSVKDGRVTSIDVVMDRKTLDSFDVDVIEKA